MQYRALRTQAGTCVPVEIDIFQTRHNGQSQTHITIMFTSTRSSPNPSLNNVLLQVNMARVELIPLSFVNC
jgi:hypothetical protein